MITAISFKLLPSDKRSALENVLRMKRGVLITKEIEDFIPKIFQNVDVEIDNHLEKKLIELSGEDLHTLKLDFLNYCLFHVNKVKNDDSQKRKEYDKFNVFGEELPLFAKNKIDSFLIMSNGMFELIEEAITENITLYILIEIINPRSK